MSWRQVHVGSLSEELTGFVQHQSTKDTQAMFSVLAVKPSKRAFRNVPWSWRFPGRSLQRKPVFKPPKNDAAKLISPFRSCLLSGLHPPVRRTIFFY